MNGKPLVVDSLIVEPVVMRRTSDSARSRTSANSCDDEILVRMFAANSKECIENVNRYEEQPRYTVGKVPQTRGGDAKSQEAVMLMMTSPRSYKERKRQNLPSHCNTKNST